MSTNIRVERICQFCQNTFIAKTTVTKYCGDTCAKRAYKKRKKDEKIQKSHKETRSHKSENLENLKAKEFLTVTQASLLLNCSRQNIYKLINSDKLPASNLLQKKTLIRRTDIDELITKSKTEVTQRNNFQVERNESGIIDLYSISEIQNLFTISESALQELLRRNGAVKYKHGRSIFIPKEVIENLLSPISNTSKNIN